MSHTNRRVASQLQPKTVNKCNEHCGLRYQWSTCSVKYIRGTIGACHFLIIVLQISHSLIGIGFLNTQNTHDVNCFLNKQKANKHFGRFHQ